MEKQTTSSPGNRLPKLTDEQRRAALTTAIAARRIRADLKNGIKAGTISINDVFDKAETTPTIGGMYVYAVLDAIPMIGKKRALKILDEVGIAHNRHINAISEKQKHNLIAYVNEKIIKN